MNDPDETELRPPNPGGDLSLHGLSITPERPLRPSEPLPPPSGGFTFVRELGRGGMGVVYEAREDVTGRGVALKIIAQRLWGSGDAAERFQREARLAASIAHPNCVFIFGAHAIQGAPAISMELMGGGTLEDRMRSPEPIPVATAVQWTIEILEGLAAAHAMGVIHRDVKPSNCFLTADGHVKVGDFGLSRSIDADLGLTQSGTFLGSPLYASPEQVRGRAVDQRADVYSAGATLYALLAGRPPHGGSSLGDVLASIVADVPPPLASLRAGLPRGLDSAVARALAKDPAKRFKDAAAFRNALLPFAPGSLSPATLGLRIVAYVIDALIISALYQAICAGMYFAGIRFPKGIEAPAWVPTVGLWAWLAPMIGNTLYFTIGEGAFGTTVGKRIFGLSVTTMDGGRAPLWRTLVRVLVFFAPSTIPMMLWGVDTGGLKALFRLPTYLVPMVTMRPSNAWRGFHEFASGTRVQRSVQRSLASSAVTVLDPARPLAAGLPRLIGPYAIEGAVGSTRTGTVVIGRDESLDRRVWIHLGGHAAPDPVTAGRAAPLRWLSHGDDPEPHDLYEAPGGASLLEHVAAGVTFPWTTARAQLLALAEELAPRGDLLPLSRVWIDRTGRLRVLPFEIDSAESPGVPPLELLSAVGKMLVSGAAEGAPRLPADLPVHADAPLRRILGLAPPFATLEQARDALRAVATRATMLTPVRRLAQMGLASLWLGYAALIILIGASMIQDDLAKRGALTQMALDRSRAGMGVVMLLTFVLAPTFILSFALRGGLSFTIAGIRVRNRAGEMAARFRCLLRSIAANLPALPYVAGCVVTFMRYWSGSELMIAGATMSVAAYVGGALWSLRDPAVGLPDRIARTRLVVR